MAAANGRVNRSAQVPLEIPLTLWGTYGNWDVYRGTQLVRVYWDGDGNNGPFVECGRYSGNLAEAICVFSISGYLIDK